MERITAISSENYYLILACLCMFGGQACVWFGSNSQIVWDWWADKPILAAVVYGIPASLLFWHGTKYGFAAMNELWGPRFLGFGMSYLTFPVLTWWLANETMFTAKTMVCVLLSFTIMGIQIFWK
jgi:hypothetical protein